MGSETGKSQGVDPTRPVGPGNPPADTMWKPGQSGNPDGPPKGYMKITDRLKKALADDAKAEAFIEAVIAGAKSGNAGIIKEIFDRVDGPVKQLIEQRISESPEHYDESELSESLALLRGGEPDDAPRRNGSAKKRK